jgi:site-specific DNA-cytosine methylase
MFDYVTDIPQPKDKGILLKDIIEHGYVDRDKARAILQSESRINTNMDLMYKRYTTTGFGNIVYQLNPSKESGGKQPYQGNRVYSEKGKHACLTESMAHREKIAFEYKGEFKIRPLTKSELCRLQGFPDNYCDILSRKHAASLLGDGWTLPIIEHIFSFLPNP